MTPSERRIALFIDFENLVTNTGISATHFDLQPALDKLLERGKVIFRRAYCDWSRFRKATQGLHELGVELIDVPPTTRAGKNSADMRLVIDALELCYARSHIDTFVIASGDSDFCPLAYKLRENGRTVIGVGVKESTSTYFVKACDEFLYLTSTAATEAGSEPPSRRRRSSSSRRGSKAKEPVAAEPAASEAPPAEAPAEEKPKTTKRRGSRGGTGSRSGGSRRTKNAPAPVEAPAAATEELPPAPPPARAPSGGREVPVIAREVITNLLARATGPVNPSLLKEAIVRKAPDFDERAHGFSNFLRLLGDMESQGLLRRQQNGRQWYVLPPVSENESRGAR